jgi:hypothetical protein
VAAEGAAFRMAWIGRVLREIWLAVWLWLDAVAVAQCGSCLHIYQFAFKNDTTDTHNTIFTLFTIQTATHCHQPPQLSKLPLPLPQLPLSNCHCHTATATATLPLPQVLDIAAVHCAAPGPAGPGRLWRQCVRAGLVPHCHCHCHCHCHTATVTLPVSHCHCYCHTLLHTATATATVCFDTLPGCRVAVAVAVAVAVWQWQCGSGSVAVCGTRKKIKNTDEED